MSNVTIIGKDSDAGRDWGQEEKGTTENEMAGWHHQLDGHEFGWTPGVDDGQGGLACCDSWNHRVGHDWATDLNLTEPFTWFARLVYTFPGASRGKEAPAYQSRRGKRCGFNPWVGKIPWKRKWQPTPIFLPREFHGQSSLGGYIQPMGSQRVTWLTD